ncbi:hypothetical protein JN06_01558 [Bacteroides zoogleoformans]|uniref:Cell surface protein n=1 Tax=Bacteroides zoogleoformans TaxID=28119 RepID=A0ABN5IIF7_9BACE|nr:hypothetical protein [Bacteroides zoogleoformans]AVM52577.1 hypothetical protein C4H11_06160 [Bacteroides zoogleoformans]TWJ14129.1 hypothetical protein JN06_01558 [Bacteroides zoogleoformans]
MNKKYLSVILFGALMTASTSLFTSCKDYDDDIKNLQEQVDKKASLEQLTAQVTTLQNSINDAKSEATAAKTAAETAKTEAKKALDKANANQGGVTAAELAALKEALEKADKDLKAQIDKLATLEKLSAEVTALKKEMDSKIAALKTEMDGKYVKTADLAAKVDALTAKLMTVLGHRLSTLSVITTSHINGIAAISLTTLQYTPQRYQALPDHTTPHATRPVLDHVNAGTPLYISTDNNEAYFHVSPSVGVRTQDVEMPSFDCIMSENIVTRGATIKENDPVKPVSYSIDKNVMTVKFKKTVVGSIMGTQLSPTNNRETFHMVSLKTPIAEANYTAQEKEAGKKVYVNSEYVRLHERIKVPYIANSRTDFSKPVAVNEFADEVQTDLTEQPNPFYVHYSDSVDMYKSLANIRVDYKWQYNKPLDLKKLVTVCVTDATDGLKNHAGHSELKNYKDYGLTYRFYKAAAPYITKGGPEGNTNLTDQQRFAQIDSPANGILTSGVYTITDPNATSVGREPIIRAELIDSVNKKLVAIRYFKIKWVKETGERPISIALNDEIYKCGNYDGVIGTQYMNEKIYAQAKEGGMTKQEFHAVYTDPGFDGTSGKGQGTATIRINSESGVDSYNIIWTLTHTDIVTKYPDWNKQEKMDFSKIIYWRDPSGAYPTLVITLTRTIYKPVFNLWGYDGRYWKQGTDWSVFNVNPIVYNTTESNPAWGANTTNNPTCNIYTDLLNGYLDDLGKKPTTGADGAIWYANKNVAGKKFYYSVDYPTTAPGHLGVAGAPTYEKNGVRFIFDAEKLATVAYKYDYFNGTKVVPMSATVSPDGTRLYINAELAATIVNTTPNNLDPTELTYNIKLEENNPAHTPFSDLLNDKPTEAAKAIVGKLVPIKMVADLCYDGPHARAHTVLIKAYDAFIIEPLKVKEGTTDNFTDATITGSTISVKNAFTYISWNADASGNFYTVKRVGTPLEVALWNFYEATEAIWQTDRITSNLKLVGGNLIPTAGVTNGPLPSNTKVTYDSTKEELTYYNYSGTPVNWDYKLYIPVKFGYKWKTFTKTFEVIVKKNAGTPGE